MPFQCFIAVHMIWSSIFITTKSSQVKNIQIWGPYCLAFIEDNTKSEGKSVNIQFLAIVFSHSKHSIEVGINSLHEFVTQYHP